AECACHWKKAGWIVVHSSTHAPRAVCREPRYWEHVGDSKERPGGAVPKVGGWACRPQHSADGTRSAPATIRECLSSLLPSVPVLCKAISRGLRSAAESQRQLAPRRRCRVCTRGKMSPA